MTNLILFVGILILALFVCIIILLDKTYIKQNLVKYLLIGGVVFISGAVIYKYASSPSNEGMMKGSGMTARRQVPFPREVYNAQIARLSEKIDALNSIIKTTKELRGEFTETAQPTEEEFEKRMDDIMKKLEPALKEFLEKYEHIGKILKFVNEYTGITDDDRRNIHEFSEYAKRMLENIKEIQTMFGITNEEFEKFEIKPLQLGAGLILGGVGDAAMDRYRKFVLKYAKKKNMLTEQPDGTFKINPLGMLAFISNTVSKATIATTTVVTSGIVFGPAAPVVIATAAIASQAIPKATGAVAQAVTPPAQAPAPAPAPPAPPAQAPPALSSSDALPEFDYGETEDFEPISPATITFNEFVDTFEDVFGNRNFDKIRILYERGDVIIKYDSPIKPDMIAGIQGRRVFRPQNVEELRNILTAIHREGKLFIA